MQEKLLHFIWQNLLFNTQELKTTEGQSIQIISKGSLNTHAGPDFIQAKIKIDQTLWVGNVEIHISASDWNKHGHTSDKSYDNTILHVCWEEDISIKRTDGSLVPCFTLKQNVDQSLLQKYQYLMSNSLEIPCANNLSRIDDFTLQMWLERLAIERLESKTIPIFNQLEASKHNWQSVFYISMAKTFGLKINTQPFENLAQLLSLKLISRHKNNLMQLEALLFGVAGFLQDAYHDDYIRSLQQEFKFLKTKYHLIPMDKNQWKLLRLMPANFPSIRIAQFAALMHHSNHLFSKIIEENEVTKIIDLFKTQTSDYWQTHYLPDIKSSKLHKSLGINTIHNIIINTVVPFKFAYGKYKADENLQQNALDILEYLPPEQNSIIKKWSELGILSKNSFQTQALLQLKNEYCNTKNCLRCQIGCKLLKN